LFDASRDHLLSGLGITTAQTKIIGQDHGEPTAEVIPWVASGTTQVADCYRLHYLGIWRQHSMMMNRQLSLVIVGVGLASIHAADC